jgi:DNA repair ATPase RecN
MTWEEVYTKLADQQAQTLRDFMNSPRVRSAFLKQEKILLKLEEIERKIQMTHDEAIAKLQDNANTLQAISDDTDRLLALIGQLQNADVAPDIAALIDQVDTTAHSIDDKVPEPPPAP